MTALFIALFTRPPGDPTDHARDYLKTLVRLQIGAVKWLVAGLPGAAVVLMAFGVVWIASDHSCAAPVDLRILTAEENVPALTEAAAHYVADRSGDGCRNAIVTVSAGSATQDIESGFTRGWKISRSDSGSATYFGPRPDVWIPDTTAAAVEAQTYLGNSSGDQNDEAELEIGGSVGTSPMVIAVFGNAYSPPGAHPGSLDSLYAGLKAGGVDVPTRPSAKTSEAALVSTPVLSTATQHGYGVSAPQAEKVMSSGGSVAGDAAAILCRFRAQDIAHGKPPAHTAVVVPEIALARYDNNLAIGTGPGCESGRRVPGDPARFPAPAWRMYPYYAGDLPVLDHPFVHVRWPGEVNEPRDHLVEDFRSWLAVRSPGVGGFRTPDGRIPDGSAGELRELSGLYDPGQAIPSTIGGKGALNAGADRAKAAAQWAEANNVYRAGRPSVSLKLLFDISGSMATPLGDGEPRLYRAQEIARSLLQSVRDDDKIQVSEFSTRARVSLDPRADDGYPPGDRGVLRDRIQNERANGSDQPLAAAISDTAKQVGDPDDLVVLTDGQLASTNAGTTASAAALRKAYPDLRVHIVLTGPKTCGDALIKQIAGVLGPHTCVDGSIKPPDDTADAVLAAVLWGDGA
ncbi:VWA domain-containing protein [Actinomadura sp. DC4]|uniref:vWA domain-containing protein n=1 Tax=Actinomadura sp. DC4 TaxID=3055069 RepID=UPI0025B238C0|nr:VWA domain-containing protein [Actinomadura sp. DC4]MDN3354390.1 hypothetical protein [Actinomadura sp. DC4]